MIRVFADTFYYLAIMNANDAAHGKAVQFSESMAVSTITTSWVLTELADAMASPSHRGAFLRLLNNLRANPICMIVPPSQALFDQGVDLYASRSDKDWPLTDCISFVVMREHGLTDALTGDRHFEQAGFKALLASFVRPASME
jgi:hypothetical protein